MNDTQALITADLSPHADLAQVQHQLEEDLVRVRERLRSLVATSNQRIRGPIMYSVTDTGRLLRPTLALISSYLVEGDWGVATRQDVIDAATTVEILHVATLFHDDLIDQATIRRGRPTANEEFGEPIALLTGDYLLARCLRTAATLGVAQLTLMADTLDDACVGQIMETSQLYDPLRSEQDYLAAIGGKTASLMKAAAAIGALQCGADPDVQHALVSFGHNLGMAFQIWDDILDLCRTGTGKTADKDLLNGVYTLPLIYAVKDEPDRVLAILRAQQPPSPQQCDEILSIMLECGALNRAAGMAQQHVTAAFQAIEQHPKFADRAPLAGRYLVDLVSKLTARHPMLQSRGEQPTRGSH
ncbi:MAG TPA: polyprenyl synthetase family protein [Amycolatopsis sp.]|uniref:polyprenyl synthetase family protein n=1 Tax=Amycolatopsis sp. TaxID=37632 RepID=UPI002B460D3D|nr:polyprenyl synthetase family protein [Amycolatopsis sp.]HKS45791.1 polyprenyl synthetase family protein [Amycolatopsis sp.]